MGCNVGAIYVPTKNIKDLKQIQDELEKKLGKKKQDRKNQMNFRKKERKSRIRETLNISTDADSRTDTILEKLR